jgi:hypothetical protein
MSAGTGVWWITRAQPGACGAPTSEARTPPMSACLAAADLLPIGRL